MNSDVVMAFVLAGVVAAAYGLFLLIFRRGKRRRGLWLFFCGFIVVPILGGLLYGTPEERAARDLGFLSVADQERAREAGFTEASIWSTERQRIEEVAAAKREADTAAAAEAAAEQERLEKVAEEEATRVAEAEKKRKGFHCISEWDGTHQAFRRAVEASLREPDSFEHISTRITPVSEEGKHMLGMEYRARNGFGGMNVGTAMAIVANDDCSFELLTIE